MNAVILSSVISAGNHALFAGTRVLYGLAAASHAPPIFAWTTRGGVPLPALLLTSSISALCFGSSFIGNGQLWAWLQTLVGVSNQVRKSTTLFFVFFLLRAVRSAYQWVASCSRVRVVLTRVPRVDRLAVHWDCVVALPHRVEDARPPALGDEVSRPVDVAVGPSFRGERLSPSSPTNLLRAFR